jgi:hypothetical protein
MPAPSCPGRRAGGPWRSVPACWELLGGYWFRSAAFWATSGRELGHGPAGAELFPETGPMLARDWQGPRQKPFRDRHKPERIARWQPRHVHLMACSLIRFPGGLASRRQRQKNCTELPWQAWFSLAVKIFGLSFCGPCWTGWISNILESLNICFRASFLNMLIKKSLTENRQKRLKAGAKKCTNRPAAFQVRALLKRGHPAFSCPEFGFQLVAATSPKTILPAETRNSP